MKKITTFFAAMMLAASFSSGAFTLAGTDADLPEDAVKQCATAKSFWVCIDNYKQMNKK
ncbi:hypothetical protein [Photobacterium rosenbergii]|uniref:Uncharacterized protein n=1 Tax=Photobacterium rosenbergii TaxID=294936 RepID=A0ABU3ZM14_9GAMM|nr:hypothetical protein [Photobacterium rosenbergii]MDV5171154.1 hypothetical protein [Photobacterium rosenbergii]